MTLEKKVTEEFPYRIQIPIGDNSTDGHDKTETFIIRSSHPVKALEKAYEASVKKTGISFGRYHPGTVEMFTQYEDNSLTQEYADKLEELGFDFYLLRKSYFDNIHNKRLVKKKLTKAEAVGGTVTPGNVKDMLLWFVELSLPGFHYEDVEEDAHLFDVGNIGYGCFS